MIIATPAVKSATLGEARAIFARGTDFLGPEEILKVHGELHGLKLPKKLPEITWTPDELQVARARDEGAYLILVPPGFTMQAMWEKRKNLGADGGKLLYDTDWYKKEKFFTTDTTGDDWDWRLVTNEVIPNSTSQNYVEQTATLASYLTDVVFPERKLPAIYRQAADEFREQEEALTKLVDSDWQEAAKQLSNLAINRLLRETPAVIFYRLVTYLEVNSDRLLEEMYHWTPTLSSYGELVHFGHFVPSGAFVSDWCPRDRDGDLGVVLSRSAKVESEM